MTADEAEIVRHLLKAAEAVIQAYNNDVWLASAEPPHLHQRNKSDVRDIATELLAAIRAAKSLPGM